MVHYLLRVHAFSEMGILYFVQSGRNKPVIEDGLNLVSAIMDSDGCYSLLITKVSSTITATGAGPYVCDQSNPPDPSSVSTADNALQDGTPD